MSRQLSRGLPGMWWLYRVAGVAVTVLTLASPVEAQGSGTVSFEFKRWRGPFKQYGQSSDPIAIGTFLAMDQSGNHIGGLTETETGFVPAPYYGAPNAGYGLGEGTLGGTWVSLSYWPQDPSLPPQSQPSALPPNHFIFQGSDYTNVPKGVDFRLGRLTFWNRVWFPGTTELDFEIVTTPSQGPTLRLAATLQHTVNANSACGTDAGQIASADEVTLFAPNQPLTLSRTFKVFDAGCAPAGALSHGTVDLIGQFSSLELLGFSNPSGGFLVDSPPSHVVPEPSSLLLVGIGLIGFAFVAGSKWGQSHFKE